VLAHHVVRHAIDPLPYPKFVSNGRADLGRKEGEDSLMMERIEQVSPRRKARITGVFYLLTLLTGIFAKGFVSERLVLFSDAATTGTNILAHESLFRLGFTVYMVEMACQIVFIALFYELLKPVADVSCEAVTFNFPVLTLRARISFLGWELHSEQWENSEQ